MSDLPKIMPVELCGAVGRCMANPESYRSEVESRRYSGKATRKQVAEHASRKLEDARKVDIDLHEANLPAIENNKQVKAAIEAMMVAVGMPPSYRERDPKSRARFPKSFTIDAGYIGDIRRKVRTDDAWLSATVTYNNLKAKYDAYAVEAEQEAEQLRAAAEQAEAAAKAARRANIEMAAIILRYGLEPDIEWTDILDALRAKDQRVDLAVAMEDTRGDWSEGFYRVRDALDRFKIASDEDRAIAIDIATCLKNDDGDGRIFRDTTWSYGSLYASVADRQLAADAQLARSKCVELR